ncbi:MULTISPECIES: Cys-Gln thioester bond-forming surface protein [unclassified Streptomyces]|uniref:Cys-Gln thioester bond-forming surface protein n=1 Tax=unclassified Streptomyces TaxID=2593676 RepID=UPI002257FA2A|nr:MULTISPECIES: Cys-Gln thioester bond-forming surface protein [unclassified Streptomyces]MCX4880873.1 Cys-Gln thioester bond-forming surface protein [Streptomyces sp. NBC_00847]MCX5420878.1 Cys-Gln thioester bond-forming surface protein [Streptomyces sp. NBC_00078]
MFSSFSALSVSKRGAARLAAATLVSGLVAAGVLAGAGAATAEETAQSQGGATATIGGLKTYGAAVIHEDTGDQQVSAGLFEMSVDGGGTLQTYCVDIQHPTQRDAKYQETAWSGTSLGTNKDAGKIRWILQNSYPQVNDLAALAAKAGVQGGLTEQDAAAGTQVAIWRYSDAADVDAVDPQAEKLADYLHKSAADLAEPQASLTLDPPAVSGRPGELLGPVTVHTNATGVAVTPPADAATSGVRIVGKDGKPLTSAVNGSQIFFDVPEDAAGGTADASGSGGGSAEITVQASTTVPVGRAFASETRSQTQILAGSSESTVSAQAGATWAEKGPIPALSAAKNCAKGGVDITAANQGDEAFTFELMGSEYGIPAGQSRTVTIPLQEDQVYDFTIKAPGGLAKRFTGILDCRTQGSASGDATQILSEPSPASVGGTADDTNLAATGGSSATPLIVGVAIALVVIGGAALVLVGKKEAPTQE